MLQLLAERLYREFIGDETRKKHSVVQYILVVLNTSNIGYIFCKHCAESGSVNQVNVSYRAVCAIEQEFERMTAARPPKVCRAALDLAFSIAEVNGCFFFFFHCHSIH